MASYAKKIQKILEHEPFSQLMPVVEYLQDTKTFLLDEPAIGAMIICQPTSGCNDELRNAFTTIYKSEYVEGTTVQAQLVSYPDIEDALFGYRAVRKNRMVNQDQEVAETFGQSVENFFRKSTTQKVNQTGYKFKNYEFWFTVKQPIKDAVPTKTELDTFAKLVRQIASRLSAFSPFIATERDYFRRMRVLWNMYDKDGWRTKPQHLEKEFRTAHINEMILRPGKRLDSKVDGVSVVDENNEECLFIKPMSILELPEQMYYGQMLNLLGDWKNGTSVLSEPFILSLNLVFPNQLKARNSFNKGKTFITNQAQGALLKFIDKLGFQKEDYDAVDREITQENARLLKYSMQLTVFSKNREEANEFAEKVTGYYSRMNIKLMPDNHFALPFTLAAFPFGMHKLFLQYSSRFNDGTSKLATFLTPHMASWKGNTNYPALLLSTRLGQLFNFDPFSSETNYNCFLAATSGAGKSFYAGYLIYNFLGSGILKHDNPDLPLDELPKFDDGGQVFVVDVGRSYEGLAAQYADSRFLVFGNDFKYSLNPFPNIVDFYGKEGEANMLRAIIKCMAFPSGNVTDFQNSEILRILEIVWEAKGQKATITDVAEECLRHEEHEIIRIGQQLRPFTDKGIYGQYFSDKYPPVKYDARLIVCELQELDSDTHLLVTVLMTLVMSIQKQMYLSGTDKRKLFLLDEGWKYIKADGAQAEQLKFFSEFLEAGWRKFRKTNSAGVLITQDCNDGYASPAGRAIVNNSAWLLLMKQNPEAVDRLESDKLYAGTEMDFHLIRSLTTSKPKPGVTDEAFSEIFIRYEGMKQVCRLYTDRRIQLILTTTPDEKARRQRYIDQGMSMSEAIDAMIEDEQRPRF